MIKLTSITEQYYDYFRSLYSLSVAKEFGVGDNPPDLFIDLEEVKPTNGTYILMSESNEPIGYSQFGITYNRTAWFSLFIDPRVQGNGFGRIAFSTMTEKLFEEHKIKNIFHAVMITNCKMMKIIEDYGCRRVGEVRQRAMTLNEANERINTSCIQYELTLEDYNLKNSQFITDSRSSYGINDPTFLEYEKKRLLTQNSIQMGPLEKQLSEIITKTIKPIIMDLGCGLGNLINCLSAKFPDAKFIGVDSEPDFIKLATQSCIANNIEFLEKNFFELVEELKLVDVFLMRIVAQHIGSEGVSRFYKLFHKYAKPSAKLLILDIDDNSWSLNPTIAGFDLLLDSCNFNQKKFGGDRHIGSKCKDLAVQQGLKVELFQICPFDSYNIGLGNFSEIISALFEFKADSSYLESRDIKTIQTNFETWKKNKNSFGYGCLFLTQIGKNE